MWFQLPWIEVGHPGVHWGDGEVLGEGKEGPGRVLGLCGEVGKVEGIVVKEGRRVCDLCGWQASPKCPPGELDAGARGDPCGDVCV